MHARREPTDPRHTPRCPRCGYDQSGEVQTWRSACPLHGRCPECGLEFRWRYVLHARAIGPTRSVER